MPDRLPDACRIVKTEVVCPNDSNPMGLLQGGRLVQWMDIAAAVSAQLYSGTTCVTVSIDRVSFRRPARIGDILTIEASLKKVVRTSMHVRVEARTQSVGQKTKKLVSKADFVFVAIDASGRPTKVSTNKK